MREFWDSLPNNEPQSGTGILIFKIAVLKLNSEYIINYLFIWLLYKYIYMYFYARIFC